ncbi:MAG: hypothetical protein V8R82_07755 [Clostridia bacterium]
MIYSISSLTSSLYKKNKIHKIIISSKYNLIPNISKIAWSESDLQSRLPLEILEEVLVLFDSIESLIPVFFCSFRILVL